MLRLADAPAAHSGDLPDGDVAYVSGYYEPDGIAILATQMR